VQPRLADHADMILRYDAFDSEGNQIAAAFFAAMLENVETSLFAPGYLLLPAACYNIAAICVI
jgi:hypothetical protein